MFVRAANPIWFFNNLIGQPLDDTYWAFFLTNDLPYLPQNVFQDPNGIASWPDPLEFQPSAGLPNNLYFDPTLVYRIEIRQGNTQADPLIWLIQNFVPGEGTTNTNNLFTGSQNLIADSQFSIVNFTSPLTITTAGTYQIAPGWELILTGTGTTTLTQVNFPGMNALPGNPPFGLTIANSGWTTAKLVETFTFNGDLYNGGSVSMSILADPLTPQLITLDYVTSDGTTIVVASAVLPAGTFTTLAGAEDVPPPPVNPSTGTLAYTQMQIILQPTGTITITNVQFLGQALPLSSDFISADVPGYQEIPVQQQINSLFYYYLPQLEYKPIPSYLVGWDFSLNPAQFYGTTVVPQATGPNTSYYVWDQTIIFQSLTSGFTISKGGSQFGIVLTSTSLCQGAIIQYLPSPIANKMLLENLCVNLKGNCATGTTINGTISLWYTGGALPNVAPGTNQSLVLTLDENGKPASFNGAWAEVPKSSPIDATFTLTDIVTDYDFNLWTPGPLGATYFAIVVGFAPIGTTISPQVISVGVYAGEVPTIPSPQTPDEVLRECEYYYAKTFPQGVVPAQAAGFLGAVGYFAYATGAGNTNGYCWRYPVTMRATPIITTYCPNFATTAWGNEDAGLASSAAVLRNTCDKSVVIANVQLSTDALAQFIGIQATADARLGIV